MLNVIKFVGNRFNNLEKITFKFRHMRNGYVDLMYMDKRSNSLLRRGQKVYVLLQLALLVEF